MRPTGETQADGPTAIGPSDVIGCLPAPDRHERGVCQHHVQLLGSTVGRVFGDKARCRYPRASDLSDARPALSCIGQRHPPGWA